jgi:hypothetical protein
MKTIGERIGKTTCATSEVQDLLNGTGVNVLGDFTRPERSEGWTMIAAQILDRRYSGSVIVHAAASFGGTRQQL